MNVRCGNLKHILKRRRNKAFSWGIKIGIALILTIIIYRFLDGVVSKQLQLVDALSVTGMIYVFVGIFIMASNENIFASVSYFGKKLVNAFRKIPGRVAPTYYDYLVERAEEEKFKASPYFIIGFGFIVVAFIFMFYYKLL